MHKRGVLKSLPFKYLKFRIESEVYSCSHCWWKIIAASTACAAVVCCRNASAAVLVVDLVLPEDLLLPSESCDANLFYHYTVYLMKCVI